MKPPLLLSGAEMLIPVNLITDIVHVSTYNSHVSSDDILLNSALAYSIYKFDRYSDYGIRDTASEFSIFSSCILSLICIIYYHNVCIFPLYISTFLYKNIKKIDFPIKPFYVSGLWTVATCFLPDNEYISYLACLSVFMCTFGITNLADIKDIEEDMQNNVTTLATYMGENNTKTLCGVSTLIGIIAFLNLEYYSNTLYEYVYILSNIAPYFKFS